MTSVRDHRFHLDLPGLFVMEREVVANVLSTQCRYMQPSGVVMVMVMWPD